MPLNQINFFSSIAIDFPNTHTHCREMKKRELNVIRTFSCSNTRMVTVRKHFHKFHTPCIPTVVTSVINITQNSIERSVLLHEFKVATEVACKLSSVLDEGLSLDRSYLTGIIFVLFFQEKMSHWKISNVKNSR